MNHPLRCRCGTLQGHVRVGARANRGLCYCRDCQAFAHFLGHAADILDPLGGTDVIQTLPACVQLTAGADALACMRLTPNGLLRWYAKCCNTPVGNTLPNFKLSFVGLVHSCLLDPATSLDASFGPVRMRVNTKGAKGAVRAEPLATVAAALRLVTGMARARLDGTYRRTPFFHADGSPVATPEVISAAEREALLRRTTS